MCEVMHHEYIDFTIFFFFVPIQRYFYRRKYVLISSFNIFSGKKENLVITLESKLKKVEKWIPLCYTLHVEWTIMSVLNLNLMIYYFIEIRKNFLSRDSLSAYITEYIL